ncbi:MAG: HAMP domain-containing histidine kinase [Phycisphaerae bacterium]|nr:HAMP domain-containing histidine kinase [Phycisphaerae bacterium]
MTESAGTGPTFMGRLLLPQGEYRTGALRAMVRMHWFIRLRWLAIGAGGVAYLVDQMVDLVPHRPRYLLGILAILVAMNLLWILWSRRIHQRVQAAEEGDGDITEVVLFFANAQMAVDLALLTLIIRLFGGVISPVAIFYVFHVAIAALLLAPINALLQAVWALLLYSIVVFGGCAGWIGEHMPLVDHIAELPLVNSTGFVSVVYCVVASGLLGIWYLVSQVGSTLDERERDLRKTTEALLASHEAIAELQDRRTRFMRTAAHQLKSPLAGIQTLAALITDGVISGEAVQSTTAKVVRRCKEAIEQVNELLTLARLKDEGIERHQTADTPLVATLNELFGHFRDRAKSEGIELVLQVADGIAPSVRVDPRDLKDCLGNLIDNGIKYSGEGKRVEVAVELSHGGAVVCVRDDGVGMDPDTLAVVFDEFRRGNQALALQISGSGLGLSIVREILEHCGGRVTVCSTPGEGTMFRVWLPLVETAGSLSTGGGVRVGTVTTVSNTSPQQNNEEVAYAGPNRREK